MAYSSDNRIALHFSPASTLSLMLALFVGSPLAFAQTPGQTGAPVPYVPRMQNCTGGYQPPVPVRRQLLTGEDYPSASLRDEEEGRIQFVVTVGTDGLPRDVEVISSSAPPRLEQSTIALIMRRGRFMPALKDCKPVEGEFEGSVNWALP